MQGAAQTANAPPRRAREPPSAGGLEEARRGESIEERQRQQAHEREPHDDDHETGHLPHEAWVVDEATGTGDERPEDDEDDGEPGHEREACENDPPAHDLGVSGDGGQVARDERQDAGSHEGQQPGQEGERDVRLHPPAIRRSGRAPRRVAARARDRAGGLRRRPPRPEPAPRPATSRASAGRAGRRRCPPPTSPTSGRTQASRLKPRFGGAASTPSPNWSTSWSLISVFVSPAAIRVEMNARMRSEIGELESASCVLQVGQ